MRKYMPYILCSTLLVLASTFTFAEKYKTVNKPVNDKFIKKYGRSFFDVKNINPFPIPHVLDRIDNKGKITTAQEWNNIARPQILNFYDEQVYGAIPPRPDSINFELLESSKDALGGIAERRQYRITVSAKYGCFSSAAVQNPRFLPDCTSLQKPPPTGDPPTGTCLS